LLAKTGLLDAGIQLGLTVPEAALPARCIRPKIECVVEILKRTAVGILERIIASLRPTIFIAIR
jgi:hypothetical protein